MTFLAPSLRPIERGGHCAFRAINAHHFATRTDKLRSQKRNIARTAAKIENAHTFTQARGAKYLRC